MILLYGEAGKKSADERSRFIAGRKSLLAGSSRFSSVDLDSAVNSPASGSREFAETAGIQILNENGSRSLLLLRPSGSPPCLSVDHPSSTTSRGQHVGVPHGISLFSGKSIYIQDVHFFLCKFPLR